MSTEELVYSGPFSVGQRVEVVEDNEDGSWLGEFGTVIKTYRQGGGLFGDERNVTVVVPDIEDEDDLAETEEGRAQLLQKHADGDGFFLDTDTFEFEAE